MNSKELEEIIKKYLPKQSKVEIDSIDNVHFNANISSILFNEIKNKLERQKIIYRIINKFIISGEIHAISIKTNSIKIKK